MVKRWSRYDTPLTDEEGKLLGQLLEADFAPGLEAFNGYRRAIFADRARVRKNELAKARRRKAKRR